MTHPTLDARVINPTHPFLEVVRSYITLIDRSDQLTYGQGLKSLYAMKAGLVSLNDDDSLAIVKKAQTDGLIPRSLMPFMNQQIIVNCSIYALVLQTMIEERIVGICNGDIVNPPAQVMSSPQAARRAYYLPPNPLVKRIIDAIEWCDMPEDLMGRKSATLADVRQDTLLFLMNQQGRDGHSVPNPSSYKAMNTIVSRLVSVLSAMGTNSYNTLSYKKVALPALHILWVFTKLLYADLRPMSDRGDINEVDLTNSYCFEDGTLAAIPFPSQRTCGIFNDHDSGVGISMKARFYLNAVSKASLTQVPSASYEG